MLSTQILARTARRLQALWQARADASPCLERSALGGLDEQQRALRRAGRRMDLARGHGLTLILPDLEEEFRSRLDNVQRALEQLRQMIERPCPVVPSIPFLVAELRQLQDEFGDLNIDSSRRVLAVTTAPITLDGVFLGSFALEFFWERLASMGDVRCWDIVALEPNPASTDARVTHPHVKNEKLCPGDAAMPVTRALAEGRLADAFCLIRGVLLHYNSGSPHVPLDEWDGRQCHACGYTVTDDDLSGCDGCDADYCSDCITCCAACGDARCHECLERCALCEEWCCAGCMDASMASDRVCCRRCRLPCSACGALVARDELDPQTERCPACPSNLEPPSQETVDELAHTLPAAG